MHGFLLKVIQRQLQRLALGATLGMVVITTTAVVTDQLEGPAIEEAGLATGKLGTEDGCEGRDEKPSATPQGSTRTGAGLSCAAGDLYLGNGDRLVPKSGNRAALKQ